MLSLQLPNPTTQQHRALQRGEPIADLRSQTLLSWDVHEGKIRLADPMQRDIKQRTVLHASCSSTTVDSGFSFTEMLAPRLNLQR